MRKLFQYQDRPLAFRSDRWDGIAHIYETGVYVLAVVQIPVATVNKCREAQLQRKFPVARIIEHKVYKTSRLIRLIVEELLIIICSPRREIICIYSLNLKPAMSIYYILAQLLITPPGVRSAKEPTVNLPDGSETDKSDERISPSATSMPRHRIMFCRVVLKWSWAWTFADKNINTGINSRFLYLQVSNDNICIILRAVENRF